MKFKPRIDGLGRHDLRPLVAMIEARIAARRRQHQSTNTAAARPRNEPQSAEARATLAPSPQGEPAERR